MRSLYIMRFTSPQPQLAATWFRSPRIEGDLVLNLRLKLSRVEVSRSLLRLVNVPKILSDVKNELSKLCESVSLPYEKSPLFQAADSLTTSSPVSALRRVYMVHPKAAGTILYSYAETAGLRRLPRRFYAAMALEAISTPKFLGEGGIGRYTEAISSLRVVNRAYGEIGSFTERVSEATDEKIQPITEAMRGSFEPIIQVFSPALNRTYALTQKRRRNLLVYEAYVRSIAYGKELPSKPVPPVSLRENLGSLARETLWSKSSYTFQQEFYIQAYRKAWRSGARTLSQALAESIRRGLPLLSPKIWRMLEVEEAGEPSVLLERTRIFFKFSKYLPSTRQIFSSGTEYLRLVTEFFGETRALLQAFQSAGRLVRSLAGYRVGREPLKLLGANQIGVLPLVKSIFGENNLPSRVALIGGDLRKDVVGFKAAKRYGKVIGEVLPYLMERYSTVFSGFLPLKIGFERLIREGGGSYLTPQTESRTARIVGLTEYFSLMEKRLGKVHPSVSRVKAVFGGFPPIRFGLGGLVKVLSEGLSAYAYFTVSRPLFDFSYGGRVAPFQLLRIHETASLLQMFSSTPPSPERIKVQQPINVTIRVESPADEGDLRELERKIIKILREEARRYGLNI